MGMFIDFYIKTYRTFANKKEKVFNCSEIHSVILHSLLFIAGQQNIKATIITLYSPILYHIRNDVYNMYNKHLDKLDFKYLS